MSCKALKMLVAQQGRYPQDFVRLINSIAEDQVAQYLLDEHGKRGLLDPEHDFVFNTVMCCRAFLKIGLIKAEDNYLAATKSLGLLFKLIDCIALLGEIAPRENFDPGQLFQKLTRDESFQRDLCHMLMFLK
jgi:hypothetical protein